MFSTVHNDLEGLAADRFRSLAAQLKRLQEQQAAPSRLDALCQDELAWIQSASGPNGTFDKYEACVRLLTDLAKLRWRIVQDGFGLELSSPSAQRVAPDEVTTYKESIRQELLSQVHLQFESKSVRDFIRRMEKPSASSKLQPVSELIADGRELRTRLLAAQETTGQERADLCKTAIQPYLQLVEPGAKDTVTGQLLSDVWRYFRYTWAIPATNVPGRNLFYLIRDAAHPNHAVMGITGLSNAPLSLGDRDFQIGWTAESTLSSATAASQVPDTEARSALRALIESLERNVEEGLAAISHEGLLQSYEATDPTERIIQRLRRRAAEFSNRREAILRDVDVPLMVNELEDAHYGDPDVSDDVLALESKVFGDERMNAARRALTAKKRAAELARLLQARMVFRKHRSRILDPAEAPAVYALDEMQTAVNTAWVSAKNARVGTSMLELTVCGAVRPYSHLLGGKLAALLMLSPEVADDYTRRYGNTPSIISSMMKNEQVVKDSRLVFLGTTSLFLHGASQYNRLKLPASVISPDQETILYRKIGETGGFGTVQFSPGTVEAIERVVMAEKGFRQVNSVFGEGRSPKLRKLRTGLDLLGFDADILLQHHQPRIIYGVMLYPGAAAFLRTGQGGMPDFILRPQDYRDATKRIAEYWTERWLSKRLDHPPAIENLSKSRAWKLSLTLPASEVPTGETPDSTPSASAPGTSGMVASEPDLRLWRSLAAAGHDSCSDCLSDDDLDRLHVPSALEEFLVEKASQAFTILLTGNAGDGKTHLLRRIAPSLERANAIVDLDATAVMRKGSVGPILDRWRRAIDAGRPYCLAANEYPLHELIRTGRGLLPDPLHDELARQTIERLAYTPAPTESEAAHENLLVVDLSLRNPLVPSFSLAALRRMLSDSAILAQVDAGNDPDFAWNHRKLSTPLVQSRLAGLFQRLVDRGYRCTIRELWILLARLLFGDPRDQTHLPTGSPRTWYSTRLWSETSGSGRFRLVQLLLKHADPVSCSHPYWDWKLEHPVEMAPSEWLDSIPPLDLSHRDPKIAFERFAALKRRFYFEHDHGEETFALAPGHGNDFSRLLNSAAAADDVFKGAVLRAINHAYCPKPFSGNDRDLHLWFSHRFHEQPTRAYIANRSVPTAHFAICVPRLPQRLGGAFAYSPDHLSLECTAGGSTARLRIDAALYATLDQLAAGFPRHLAPESELNKLDDFLSRLHRARIPQSRQFLIYSAESRLATRITLDETLKRYMEVQKL